MTCQHDPDMSNVSTSQDDCDDDEVNLLTVCRLCGKSMAALVNYRRFTADEEEGP